MDRLEIKAALNVDDAGEITGIAWPFGSPDRVGDVITKGAFTAPDTLPMLFAHDQAQVVGVWDSITETAEGLTVKGRLLVDDVARAREVRAMIRSKAVSGLSIGFRTKASTPRPGRGRTITALDLGEISIVAVPSHPGATITSMKAATDGPAPEKETPRMEPEIIENEPEAKSEPAIEKKAFDDLKAQVDKLTAKLNRPNIAAPSIVSPEAGNRPAETKALSDELKQTLLETKALTIAAPGTAENLINDTLLAEILEKIGKTNPIRQLARTVSIGGGLLKIPRLVDSVAPGSVTETGTKPESTATFEQIDLQPFMMGAQVMVSKSTIEDSAINLVSWLSSHLADRFGELESTWFVTGNGTTQAEGVMTSTEVQEIDGAGTAITVDDLLDLFYSVKTTYANAGAWLMNRKTMRAVRGLRDGDGNLIWQPGLQAGQPALILGRPVYAADDMPDPVAGNNPVMFGDFYRGYMIADRVSFEPFVDYNKFWENDLVQFGARRRVGGKVVMGEALSKLKLAAA